MSVTPPIWHGTAIEWDALSAALDRYCGTELGQDGDQCRPARRYVCAMYRALVEQRALDRLFFVRRIRLSLLAEELATEESSDTADPDDAPLVVSRDC